MTELVASLKDLIAQVRKLESENRKLNRMIARLESKAEKPARATRTAKAKVAKTKVAKTKMGARKVKATRVTKVRPAKKMTKTIKVTRPKRNHKVSSRKVESFEL